jgi:UDP-N-acetylmuramoyl-L-alanyl-D-glutamate--2,6-diaminopimelate ligase
MRLHSLLRQLDSKFETSAPDSEITGVVEDSRKVQQGNLFIARHGTRTDGSQFLNDAQAKGAAAAIVSSITPGCPLPQIVVEDTARAASLLANLYHGRPSSTVRTVAVTGTNGKTTTTFLVRHLLSKVNQRCGMIGTVEIDDGKNRYEAEMTTPGACDVAALLATMRDKGCRAAAMEVSSHALDQQRTAGVTFAGAAFTNLTGDHLDYHKTMEAYAAAKARLFTELPAEAVAVMNADDKFSARMIQDCPARIMKYGFGTKADYRAKDVSIMPQGTSFTLITPDGKAPVQMPMVGKHNIENALAAATLVGEVYNLTVTQIAQGLRDAHGAPGRLEPVRCGQGFAVLVDYAHTDDALENVLTALRPLTKGKLRVLFGCGGDRDRTKRPRMAKTAEKIADALYITSDNPRTEDPQSIVEQVFAGLSKQIDKSVFVDVDRRHAIDKIIQDAEDGDVVLIAGKGHENYQIIGTAKTHFDDREEAMRILKSRVAVA